MLFFNTFAGMANKPKFDKKMFTQTVRISEELNARLDSAADKLGAKQDVVRLALDIGLAHLENIKYDLAKCVLEKSLKK